MARRLGIIGRGTLLGMVWGVVAARWYGISWQQGVIAGLALWGPCIFTAVPGPYAEIYDSAPPDQLAEDLQ